MMERLRNEVSRERVVRVAPNISATMGHYGHVVVMLVGSWIAQAVGGRLIVRIDWSVKTRGSLHEDASRAERRFRDMGFRRLLCLAEYCGASEVIDEFGVRHSLDGVARDPVYRVLPGAGERMPIAYDYDVATLTDEGFDHFLKNVNGSYSQTANAPVSQLPLIAEQTHVRCSQFPADWIGTLRELCVRTGQPPRRFHKAYCHLEMDRLLGVTNIVRGNDSHANRIREVHENEMQRCWGIPLPTLYRVPLLTFRGQKVSSSEEDGIQGLYPRLREDIERLARAVVADPYLKNAIPTVDGEWFGELLKSGDPLLDAPIWREDPLRLPENLARGYRTDRTRLFIVCGPPGVGKGTVLTLLAQEQELNLARALSVTTRPPGLGERDGIDYHFVSTEEFARLRQEGLLFGGTAPQFGYEYGIKIRDITDPLRQGQSVLAESNLRGIELAKATFHGVVAIFLCSPSAFELCRRLMMRERDDRTGIELRIEEGRRMMASVEQYSIDYFVVNDSLQRCVAELKAIILKEARG